jgi:hypothetical protein
MTIEFKLDDRHRVLDSLAEGLATPRMRPLLRKEISLASVALARRVGRAKPWNQAAGKRLVKGQAHGGGTVPDIMLSSPDELAHKSGPWIIPKTDEARAYPNPRDFPRKLALVRFRSNEGQPAARKATGILVEADQPRRTLQGLPAQYVLALRIRLAREVLASAAGFAAPRSMVGLSRRLGRQLEKIARGKL